MAATNARIGYGAKLEINTTGGTTTSFTAIAELTSLAGPSASAELIDGSHMESPNTTREFIGGMLDGGEVNADVQYVPATHKTLYGYVGVKHAYRITWPSATAVTCGFSAVMTNFEPTAPVDDKMTASLTLKVAGALTI